MKAFKLSASVAFRPVDSSGSSASHLLLLLPPCHPAACRLVHGSSDSLGPTTWSPAKKVGTPSGVRPAISEAVSALPSRESSSARSLFDIAQRDAGGSLVHRRTFHFVQESRTANAVAAS